MTNAPTDPPLVIHFAGISRSDALENAIRFHVDRLQRHVPAPLACRVALSSESKRAPLAGPFRARVAVVLPGRRFEVVVSKADARDAYNVLRDAFDAVDRRLHDSDQLHGCAHGPKDLRAGEPGVA